MADGQNETRALRILEIVSDFRTLQTHIRLFVTQQAASPRDRETQALEGYILIRQCNIEAQRLLAVPNDPDAFGIRPGQVPPNEPQRVALRRIILDISTRRFQAHRIYLRATAATRWIQSRAQVLQRPNPRNAEALRALDQRLRQELATYTDQHVFEQLRRNDSTRRYWLNDDPSLQQILAWIQQQH